MAVVERWLLWGDRGVIIYAIFFREYNMFIVLNSCLLSPIMIIIQSKIIYRDKIRKNLIQNYVLSQNVNVTKRERFETFAISIVDNSCFLQQDK